jgi:2-iminobutanoate/2-iminopropanoate deaminase
MTMREIIVSDRAPKAIGPYSVANRLGELVFTAGQLGLDPATMQIVAGGIEAETRQALTNIKNVLEAAGSSLDRVLKTTVYLRDMAEFAQMNAVYGEFFPKDPPARTTIQAGALPKAGAVEIEVIAAAG